MNFSVQGISKMIKFLEEEPAQTLILHTIPPSHDVPQEDGITGKETASELYEDTSSYNECLFPSLMTEIQLKNKVDRLQSEKKDTKTDVVTLAGYCVHSTVVPAIVPKFFCAK